MRSGEENWKSYGQVGAQLTIFDWAERLVQPRQPSIITGADPCWSYSDDSYFFSPADGIILYQQRVQPGQSIVEIKGRAYSESPAS